MSNSVEIDELITLISFPYIVGLSEPAVNPRRVLFMRSAARRDAGGPAAVPDLP